MGASSTASRPWRFLWWHVWVLSALAAAPVLDVLRGHPEFLIANDFDRWRLAAAIALLLIVLPAPLLIAAWTQRRTGSSWPAVLLLPGSAVICLLLWQRLSSVSGAAAAATLAVLAVLAVLTLLWSYPRHGTVRRFLGWLGLVAIVAPVQLTLDPAVRRVVASTDQQTPATLGASLPPVVILVLDELPITTLLDVDGAVDRRRFPNLARLASHAHWFENMQTVDGSTPRAVTALLTGSRLPDGLLPIARDRPRNLFTLLAPHARISAFEPVTRLCPVELNALANDARILGASSWLLDVAVLALHVWLPSSMSEQWLPPIAGAWRGFTTAGAPGTAVSATGRFWQRLFAPRSDSDSPDRAQRFRSFLTRIDSTDRGALYFFHLMLPHRPWMYLPQGQLYLADSLREIRDFGRPYWPDDVSVAARAYQRHLLQAEFTDQLVGELLARLAALDIYDQALVVVAADHGISFRPGDRMREVTASNSEDILQVPLVIKLPGQRRAVVHREARSTLDLLPTLLAALDVDPPPGIEGQSALEPPQTDNPEPRLWTGLAHRTAWFGNLEQDSDLFAFGPFAGVVGSRVEALAPVPRNDLQARVLGNGRQLMSAVEEMPLPAWSFGLIEGGVNFDGFGIAVVIDGVVVATGSCRLVEGQNRFNVLLPSSALAPGAHQLDILMIEPASGAVWRPAAG